MTIPKGAEEMSENEKKYVLYRTPEGQIYLPYGVFGWNSHSVEINGETIITTSSNGATIIEQDVRSIRPVTQTRITKAYTNGEITLTTTEYVTRLARAREHRSEIPKEYEDACPRYTWDDKEAMFEEHLLTQTYQPIAETISVFGEFINFTLIDLPRSEFPEIVPVWTTCAKFTDSCILDRKVVFNATLDSCRKKYPEVKINLFEHSLSFFSGNQHVDPVYRGNKHGEPRFLASYDNCLKERDRIISELERAFRIAAKVDIPVPGSHLRGIPSTVQIYPVRTLEDPVQGKNSIGVSGINQIYK